MRLGELNQKKNKYVYTTIDKLPSVAFFTRFPSLSHTESAPLPSLIN